MGVEEVIENLTITFPRALIQEEFEQLLYFVANYNLFGQIDYTVEQKKSVGPKRYEHPQKKPASKETVEYTGTVYQHTQTDDPAERITVASTSFRSERTRDFLRVQGIKFQTVPGWRWEEYDPKERKLMGEIRDRVSMYFSAIDEKGFSLEDALDM